jgi:hypothetical protein
MYIVPIAWLYVALMMAVAEATGSGGTVLGAVMTFVLYGLGPVALVLYLMGSPMRRRAIKAQEAQAVAQAREQALEQAPEQASPTEAQVQVPTLSGSAQPDAGGHTATDAVATVGKEP